MAYSRRGLSAEEIMKMLNDDVETDNIHYSDLSEFEENSSDEEEHDATIEDDGVEDEFEAESGDECEELVSRKVIYGKNGHKWYRNPFHSANTRTRKQNLVHRYPGAKNEAVNVSDEKNIFSLFFTDEMLHIICVHTNSEIDLQKTKFSSEQSYIHATNVCELKALIGIFYLSGVLRNSGLNTEEMWSQKLGPPPFRATMSKNRFEFLLNCLRFDDKSTRQERREFDKFAPVREIWDIFMRQCRSNYTPFEHVTVDEQLLGFRGRCPFKMYIPSKPDKYGIKIVMMCDSKTYYMCYGIPYVGKEQRDSQLAIPTQYVLRLTEDIQGTNRNITVDNWFTSCELAKELMKVNLTLVGTMRKNKADIPPQLLQTKGKNVSSSEFVFNESSTMVSFITKRKKAVILLSTMHFQPSIDDETGKPEMILFYNATKGGVDTFDQLCHSKTVSRKTRRWPLRVFYGMLDAAGVNSFVIYCLNNPSASKMKRSAFLKSLAFCLFEDHMKMRLSKGIPKELRSLICGILGSEESIHVNKVTVGRPGRCAFCPRNKDRKGQTKCVFCSRSLCAEHRQGICGECKDDRA